MYRLFSPTSKLGFSATNSLKNSSQRSLSRLAQSQLKSSEGTKGLENLIRSQAYINGEWQSATNGATFEVFNPYNGETIGVMADMGVYETQQAIDAAYDAFENWKLRSAKERGQLLINWYNLMTKYTDELAEILSTENGKPVSESKNEIAYAASFFEWYAAEGRRVCGDVLNVPGTNRSARILKEPVGVVGVIVPWNFPYAMMTRKLGAALSVGCTAVVKTAEDTPYSTTVLAELAEEAGIPAGVVNILSCRVESASDVGKLLCDDSKVSMVSFTGSTEVGSILMSQCAPYIKRVSMELGGLAPFIVFDSADMKHIKPSVIGCKFRNAGQACISSQLFLLQEGIHDRCVEKLVEVTIEQKMGDPFDPCVTIGPMINERGLQKVKLLVDDAVSKGAQVLCGGRRATEIGSLFYEPTVLTNVTQDMDIVHQEVFGPVITCIKFKTEEEALKIANQSDRGLAGYFFSKDLSQCYRVQEQLEMGLVGCNTGAISCTELPFSGFKQSGIGSESGVYGVDEFLLIKSVVTNI